MRGSRRVVPRATRSREVGRHDERAGRAAFHGPYRRRADTRHVHRAMRSVRRSTEPYGAGERALRAVLADRPMPTVFVERNDPFGFADR